MLVFLPEKFRYLGCPAAIGEAGWKQRPQKILPDSARIQRNKNQGDRVQRPNTIKRSHKDQKMVVVVEGRRPPGRNLLARDTFLQSQQNQ